MQHKAAEERKRTRIQALYTLEGTVLENVESIKYFGVTLTDDLKWNIHCDQSLRMEALFGIFIIMVLMMNLKICKNVQIDL